ncbi:Glycoside hydrolase, family 17 [Corchorus capsularis]|uniref:glucan endo-1,3-beta-D-glucosidase n=1 Tax=Corchorus capsularis TaxID=210143 RepID=A0A1R3HDN4_COCAP|nr:Glycoside hydrolase, family 17 [Corchorus capsularis]
MVDGVLVKYNNVFDMMLDVIISTMEKLGHRQTVVMVTKTGWPTGGGDLISVKEYAKL